MMTPRRVEITHEQSPIFYQTERRQRKLIRPLDIPELTP